MNLRFAQVEELAHSYDQRTNEHVHWINTESLPPCRWCMLCVYSGPVAAVQDLTHSEYSCIISDLMQQLPFPHLSLGFFLRGSPSAQCLERCPWRGALTSGWGGPGQGVSGGQREDAPRSCRAGLLAHDLNYHTPPSTSTTIRDYVDGHLHVYLKLWGHGFSLRISKRWSRLLLV